MALILDTGPLFAAADRRDAHHLACRQLLESASERLVIPGPVLVELDYWLGRFGGAAAQTRMVEDITSGAYDVEDLLPEDYERVRDVMLQYADASIGFVDAAVLAIVERLGETKLATLDRRHFGLMRPAHLGALELLPS